jgi:hypothetical protein
MKIDKLKEIFEDESLKYALATNLAKYGRPQSKKSDKKATLTKGLEKKREKNVKDLKKSMDEKVDLVHVTDKDGKMFGTGERVKDSNGTTTVRFDAETTKDFPTSQVKTVKEQDMGSPFPGEAPNKGYTTARDLIATLRKEVYPKFNDDELEEFRNEMKEHLGLYLKEDKDTGSGLERIKFHFDKLFGPDLKFNINRDPNNPERDRIDVRGSQQDLMDFGSELQGEKMEGYEVFWTDDDDRGQIVRIVKSDSINEKKDKADRCLRIARRKIPQSSAYRSGLIVKCRKGMIWKKEK